MGELARRVGVSQPAATRTVARLGAAGLVEKARDGRAVRVRAREPPTPQ